jgi:hypothetical protein
LPTATQLAVLTHDTPISWLTELLGSGLESTDQVLPFHDSIRVSVALVELMDWPTATQCVALTQETAVSWLVLPTFWVGVTDQVLPFQCSASVSVPELLV